MAPTEVFPANRQPRRPAPSPSALVLGRYRLDERLGAGGFGVVWLARDEHLERSVAVKVLPHRRGLGRRAEREALAAARLNHPAIVTLYEAGSDAEATYLVSELVQGRPLDELLDAGLLSDRDVVVVGLALVDALAHAHAHGVIHRDVKPGNVMIPDRPTGRSSVAKLTDFGVARLVGDDPLTRTNDVVGTLAYMAPEQAEGREAGEPADLYSLALVLYEAFAGVNPVRAAGPAATARRLGDRLPPLLRARRDLPRDLCEALDRALDPEPAARGSLADLRAALDGDVDVVEDSPGVVSSRGVASSRGRMSAWWLAPVLAPALAAFSLAWLFPLVAALAGPWWRRAAVGALGYGWLMLADAGARQAPALAGAWALAALALPPLLRVLVRATLARVRAAAGRPAVP